MKLKTSLCVSMCAVFVLAGCGGGGTTGGGTTGGSGAPQEEYPVEVNGYPVTNYLLAGSPVRGQGISLELVSYECYVSTSSGEYLISTEGHTDNNGGWALSGADGPAEFCTFAISRVGNPGEYVEDIYVVDRNDDPFEYEHGGWEYQVGIAAPGVDTEVATFGDFGEGRIPFIEIDPPEDTGIDDSIGIRGSFSIYSPNFQP